MDRIVQCMKPIENEYITVGEQYTFSVNRGTVTFRRVHGTPAGSFMNYEIWKRALANGSLKFIK